ncbi:MAG TPA: GNAT family N-acetyltransferase [Candidatus Acetothermia bacterium]|nr:GNAT family N-acetyltransferase [Candidatus Acetothermia bacterium]
MIFREGRTGDLEGIVRLLNLCFGTYRRWGLDEERYLAWVEHDPGFGWEGVLVAEERGEIVGHLNVLPRELSLSGCWVRIAGIANVAVHPGQRRRGVARGLMVHALDRVRAPLAGLFAGFGEAAYALYRSLGFLPLFFTRYAVVAREMVWGSRGGASVRRASEADSPVLQSLYEKQAHSWDGMARRDEGHFRERVFRSCATHTFFRASSRAEVLIEESGRGYAVIWPRTEEVPPGMGVVGEMVWEDEETCVSLLLATFERMDVSGLKVFAPSFPPRVGAEWFRTPEVLMLKPLDPSGELELRAQRYVFPADRW